jgi:AcrR family transcriptional regulator
LQCATDLFAAKGFERTSIRDICESAAISRPVLYYFYGSKEGLFRAVITRTCRHFNAQLVMALNDDHEFGAKCRHLVARLFEDAVDHPQLWRLMLTSIWSPAAGGNPEIANLRTQFFRKLNAEAMKAAVRHEIRADCAAAVVHVVFGAVAFVAASFLSTGKPDLTSTLAESVVNAIVDGLALRVAGASLDIQPRGGAASLMSATEQE